MGLIQDKSSQVDYSFFETPEQHDKLHRARIEAAYRPLAVMSGMGMLAQGLVTLAAMTALLLPYGAWLVFFLFASGLPVLYVVVHHKRRQHRWERTISESERRAWYYDYLLSAPETAAELRLFGVRGRFMAAYRDIRAAIRAGRLDHERRQAVGQLAAATIGLLAAGVCMAYMGWRALQGQASLGDLVLFYGVLSQGQGVLRGLLQNAGSLYGSLLFLGNLFEFLDLPNQVADPAEARRMPPDAGGAELRFENVTFAYPGAARPVLQGFNLHLPGGQYHCAAGRQRRRKVHPAQAAVPPVRPAGGPHHLGRHRPARSRRWRRCATISPSCSRSRSTTRPACTRISPSPATGATPPGRVEWAADHAGAVEFIHGLPQGLRDAPGQMVRGGVDLSVGQWQRIALARAFLRSAPLMLLDEPTHAMDAWSEAEWLGASASSAPDAPP
jgi:ATP-binding cassette, subfamily B, bacterial